MKHTHRLQPEWVLMTSPADVHGWYRVVLWARCLTCGMQGAFGAEQNTQHTEGRLLEPGA
jgi:hypothetical protein